MTSGLEHRYSDWSWTLVHYYATDVRVYRLVGPSTLYLKLGDSGRAITAAHEAARTRWALPYLPVPRVVEEGLADGVDWLVTTALQGTDGTDQAHDPAWLVPLLAHGLRRFHQAPVAECPFDFRLDTALAQVRARAQADLIDPGEDFHPEHAHLSVADALAELVRLAPTAEDLVVCHGDYCPPNILLDDRTVTGFVDLGELGVADRWWDLAIGSWSMTWNFGYEWEDVFLGEYGVERDEAKIAFYRLLYDLAS